MAADGSIIIETRLDTDGVDRGLKEIEAAIESRMGDAENSVNNIMAAIGRAVGNTDLAAGAGNLVSAIADILSGGAATLYSAASAAAQSAAGGIGAAAGLFHSGGAALGSAAAAGIGSASAQVASAASLASAQGASAAESLRGRFGSVGRNLIGALREGIAAGASALYAKAASIAAAVVARFKSIFAIHSPSKVFRDEIGKMLMLGLRDGISFNSEVVLAALEDLSADMLDSEKKYLSEKERIEDENSRLDEEKRVREYEKRLDDAKTAQEREELIADERLRLKKKADEEYLAQLKEASEREKEIVNQLKDDITSVYKDIADYVEESLEPITDSRDKLSGALKRFADETTGYGEVELSFETTRATSVGAVVRGEEKTTFFTLAEQQQSIDLLHRYAQALETVRDRLKAAFPTETARDFMEVLAGMDVEEGLGFAETLGAAREDEFTKYIEKWSEKNALAEAIANQFYSDEFTEAVDECTEYMKDELEALGLEVPEGFFASGSASARQFGKGFSEGLDKVLEEARRMIDSFSGYAVDIVGEKTSVVNNNNNYYNNSYSINGTKSTTAESIYAVEAAAKMNKYRGL